MNKAFLILFFLFVNLNFSQQKFEVFFDFAQDYPNPNSEKEMFKWIANNPRAEVYKLSGFCDSVDVKDYNKDLSLKRINKILEVLNLNKIKVHQNLVLQPNGKNFKQSKIMAENRKVVIAFRIIPPEKPKQNMYPKGFSPFGQKPTAEVVVENKVKPLFENANEGDMIKLTNINFYLNTDEILPESRKIIEDLFQVLEDNPSMKIEIQGHICCNFKEDGMELSEARANYIMEELIAIGINKDRLKAAGFGTSKPIHLIPEKTEQERIENRRVEILITEL